MRVVAGPGTDDVRAVRADSGIGAGILRQLDGMFEQTPGLERVWLYGSRARGDFHAGSDVDLAVEMPDADDTAFARLSGRLENLELVQRVDLARWEDDLDAGFRSRIARDRRLLWRRKRAAVGQGVPGGLSLKPFQSQVLDAIGHYLDVLDVQRAQASKAAAALKLAEVDVPEAVADFPRQAWTQLQREGRLPPAFAQQPYSSRFDGSGEPIPNVCLKLPTGGGKTLLAAAGLARVFTAYLRRSTGLALWVVPNEAIYRQAMQTLSDRDHPYRQILNVAAGGRVKILDKTSPLRRADVDSHLCVMVLMLQSAARRSKETLRLFRDRGNVLGFIPRDDDVEAHWALLERVPNLDVYAPPGADPELARRQKGSIVKSSLGNVMRLLRPVIVVDEGHHAYTENALSTLDGFNPSLLMELSATPRVSSARGSGSNILVDVRGAALDEAEMIKLPIHVEVRRWSDWQSCLAASVRQLDALQVQAQELLAETARYIRPILLVQVERTGRDLRDAGYIHAEDARAFLMQLGFSERQIAVKTSEKNELDQPENIDLLSPACEVRAIITKQALQEGWDCPFAYVLCALAAGRNPASMTQLVGRILRQPHVTKTGRSALDACYVLCHDANTAEVVKGIKRSLESEGMGDLALSVSGDETEARERRRVPLSRRKAFAELKLYVPRVTWVKSDGSRRELAYESDVLGRVPWQALDTGTLAEHWAPAAEGWGATHVSIDLSILDRPLSSADALPDTRPRQLDRARVVRALLDVAPNAWQVWAWVGAVVERLAERGFSEAQLALSSASLIERLRLDLERERDRLAQQVFERLVGEGRIEFCLRADSADYVLPDEAVLELGESPAPLLRSDARVMEKSLLEPAVRTPDMNDFEVRFAGYLDQKQALVWWHRNVARQQFGLQGWRRHKVYPDFVFGLTQANGCSRVVVMETKGAQLAGNVDTAYKQALLQRLTEAFRDERPRSAGELVLEGEGAARIVCDLILDEAWEGVLEQRYFSPGA